jgi:type II secretory pathway component PulC
MRQPFWIVNSILLLLAFITAGFIYFARPAMPARQRIEPTPYRVPSKTESATFNISKIYEFDLFDTYHKELAAPESQDRIGPLPEPPTPLTLRIPEEPRPQFIEPLPVSLKGIVVVLNDDTKNRAIIMDNRTNKELSYRVGDMIEDAQLVRIFSNKVILMRSNGQQEVLYLREKDAKLDPTYANTGNWDEVITHISDNDFTINTPEFIRRVQSLGEFIDKLEITTAYRQGESVGCRINNAGPGSLAQALGFTKEDVILKVNDIPVTNTKNRLAIYNQIVGLKTGDIVRVDLVRSNQVFKLNYTLKDVAAAPKQPVGVRQPVINEVTDAQRKQLEQTHTFAPTLQEIRSRERANMLEKGKRPTRNVLSNLNE